jgi:hypothetical protein
VTVQVAAQIPERSATSACFEIHLIRGKRRGGTVAL